MRVRSTTQIRERQPRRFALYGRHQTTAARVSYTYIENETRERCQAHRVRCRPGPTMTLLAEFRGEFTTPAALRTHVEGCLKPRPSRTRGKPTRDGEGLITDARLLPRTHATYPAHALLIVDGARLLATPAQLLKLSDDDPRFGRLRAKGLYSAWDPSTFVGRHVRYSFIQHVSVIVAGGTFRARSATRLEARKKAAAPLVPRRRSRSPRGPRSIAQRRGACVDRSSGFLDTMRDAAAQERRRRNRSVRRLLKSDDYE